MGGGTGVDAPLIRGSCSDDFIALRIKVRLDMIWHFREVSACERSGARNIFFGKRVVPRMSCHVSSPVDQE